MKNHPIRGNKVLFEIYQQYDQCDFDENMSSDNVKSSEYTKYTTNQSEEIQETIVNTLYKVEIQNIFDTEDV